MADTKNIYFLVLFLGTLCVASEGRNFERCHLVKLNPLKVICKCLGKIEVNYVIQNVLICDKNNNNF